MWLHLLRLSRPAHGGSYGDGVIDVLYLVIAYQLLCAGFGYRLGLERDRRWVGAALGYVFGVIGLVVLVVSRPPTRSA